MKEAVLPFDRFPGVDTLLGPEMRSTGEVMGVDAHLRAGLRQEPDGRRDPAAPAAGRSSCRWPTADKPAGLEVARRFARARASRWPPPLGTAGYLRDHGVAVDTLVAKVGRGGPGRRRASS